MTARDLLWQAIEKMPVLRDGLDCGTQFAVGEADMKLHRELRKHLPFRCDDCRKKRREAGL